METDRNGRVSRFSHEKFKRTLMQRVGGEKAERNVFCKSKAMEKKSGILNWKIKMRALAMVIVSH